MKFGVPVCLALLAAGCAAPQPEPFPMSGDAPALTPTNAASVSGDISDTIMRRIKPNDGTLSIGGNNPTIDKDLMTTLKAHGYRLVLRNAKHAISYETSPVGPLLLVRFRIDDVQIAQGYRNGANGEMVSATPVSVTEG